MEFGPQECEGEDSQRWQVDKPDQTVKLRMERRKGIDQMGVSMSSLF